MKTLILDFTITMLEIAIIDCDLLWVSIYAEREAIMKQLRSWSSGMMLACHAGDPGSIPGLRNFCLSVFAPERGEAI